MRIRRFSRCGTLALCAWIAGQGLAACDRPSTESPSTATTLEHTNGTAPPTRVRLPDAGPPADRPTVRRVVTLYHWNSTEPGNETTHGESIEHGTPKIHLVFEVHRDPTEQGWVQVGAIGGAISIPESVRMRPLASSGEWHVARGMYTEYSLEQFGGELRSEENIQVYLAASPAQKQTLTVGTTPTMVRLPATGTLPTTPRAASGQFDAIVIVVIPVNSRRGGRYLVYALDLLPEAAGFSANGVMTHAPSAGEIEQYVHWMRDPHGMGRDRNPPIAMQPIER
jgi:hypothetical protein